MSAEANPCSCRISSKVSWRSLGIWTYVTLRGRALLTYLPGRALQPLCNILDAERAPCRTLIDSSHFHVDLYGNYVPGLCPGLAIRVQDLGERLDPENYPVLCALCHKGINGLLKHARAISDFQPQEGYLSKCHLCYDIRRFLVLQTGVNSPELQPRGFYEHVTDL